MQLLAFIGIGMVFIGGIGLLIAAFRESILWGLGCLFLSPVSLIFLILHWRDAKNPFFLQLAGLAVLFFGTSSKVDLAWNRKNRNKTGFSLLSGGIIVLAGAMAIWFYPMGILACDVCEALTGSPILRCRLLFLPSVLASFS